MKKNTKRITALIIILILGIAGFIAMRTFFTAQNERVTLFDNIKASNISEIDLVINRSNTKIIRENGAFFVEQNKNLFPADKQTVNDIISILANLSKDDIASSNKKNYEQFDVDGKNKIRAVMKDKKKISFYPGKKQSFSRSYFRLPKDPNVYISSVDFSPMLITGDFRDLSPHIINDENEVSKLSIKSKKAQVNIKLKNKTWFIGEEKANKERVEMYISQLKNYTGSDIQIKNETDLSGLIEETTLKVVENGKKKEFVLQKKDKDIYYLTNKNSKYIYVVNTSKVEALNKDKAYFLDSD